MIETKAEKSVKIQEDSKDIDTDCQVQPDINFCEEVRNAAKSSMVAYGSKMLDKDWRFAFCEVDSSEPDDPSETVSLHDLLEPKRLWKRDRLQLAIELAEAVMNLHDTKWLGAEWRSSDIHFLQQQQLIGRSIQLRPCLERPLTSKTFRFTTSNSAPETLKKVVGQGDRTHFSLGVVLVELWGEQPMIEVMKKYNPGSIYCDDSCNPINFDDCYSTIENLIGKINNDFGVGYGTAVSLCSGSWKRLYAGKKALGNAEFKKAVYDHVVLPLQETFRVRLAS
jgi:hypothetical protein